MKTQIRRTRSPVTEKNNTKARLVNAVERLLASHDHAEISLRDITECAGTNVASVHYHFGSKDALIVEVIENALKEHADEQLKALDALKHEAPVDVEDIIRAWVMPSMVTVLQSEPSIKAHIAIRTVHSKDPVLQNLAARSHAEVRSRLATLFAASLPHLTAEDLKFRITIARITVAGLLYSTHGRPIIVHDLRIKRSQETIEHLIAYLVGAFKSPPVRNV